jgi:hypothetical protein
MLLTRRTSGVGFSGASGDVHDRSLFSLHSLQQKRGSIFKGSEWWAFLLCV